MTSVERTADDVVRVRTVMVNLYLVRSGSAWVLIDAGLRGFDRTIVETARALTGSSTPPEAVVLTHGHFDHIGSLPALLDRWEVPVYTHRLERPYLSGVSPYPPPDPLVGRGSMAVLSRLYPRDALDITPQLQLLPHDGSVPGLDGWRWIHTPGHTAGHVSLFRERDRLLIAGDAVTTTKQESMIAVATQRQELHGPPAYFTQDWQEAGASVAALAALEPDILATGHGVPMRGPGMRRDLHTLAGRFAELEVPRFGRYARQPAITDENGIVALPPDPLPKVATAIAAGLVVLGLASQASRPARKQVGGFRPHRAAHR